MAKITGGVRTYKPQDATYRKRSEEVAAMMKSGRYSSVEMGRGGGYVAIEESKMSHKAEEIEAAWILADKGYKVILKDEAGQVRTPDGYIFTAAFEQRTPDTEGYRGFVKALEHAKSKGAEIALIYDKHHVYHRATIQQGLREYERFNSYRFKRVMIISNDGKLHKWAHDT